MDPNKQDENQQEQSSVEPEQQQPNAPQENIQQPVENQDVTTEQTIASSESPEPESEASPPTQINVISPEEPPLPSPVAEEPTQTGGDQSATVATPPPAESPAPAVATETDPNAAPEQTPPPTTEVAADNSFAQPAPTPPVPPSEASVSDTPQPVSPPEQPTESKGHKKLLLFLIPVLAIITVIGIVLGLQVFSSSTALASYSNDEFSINYPDGYKEEASGNVVAFTEPGEENDETLSGVIVAIEDLPESLGTTDREQIEQQLPEQVDAFIEAASQGEEQEVRNRTSELSQLNGKDVERVTAEIFMNDKKVATFNILAGVTDDKLILVAVLAHVSDESVNQESGNILNSFTLTE